MNDVQCKAGLLQQMIFLMSLKRCLPELLTTFKRVAQATLQAHAKPQPLHLLRTGAISFVLNVQNKGL